MFLLAEIFFSSFPFIIHYSLHFYLKKNPLGMNVIMTIMLSDNITAVIVKALTMPGIIILCIYWLILNL